MLEAETSFFRLSSVRRAHIFRQAPGEFVVRLLRSAASVLGSGRAWISAKSHSPRSKRLGNARYSIPTLNFASTPGLLPRASSRIHRP
jgi:hypothetical protein